MVLNVCLFRVVPSGKRVFMRMSTCTFHCAFTSITIGSPSLISHHPFSLNNLFSCLPKTKRGADRHMKAPTQSAYLCRPLSLPCPDLRPSFHLSTLAKLTAARLPASIPTGGVRCAATRLYWLLFRQCSNSLAYRWQSICDTYWHPGSWSGPE